MAYEMCTDRCSYDLKELQRLLGSGYDQWTSDDKKIWTGEIGILCATDGPLEATDGQLYCSGKVQNVNTQRGAWNYTDLNRIRTAMIDLRARLNEQGYFFNWPYTLIGAQSASGTPGSYLINTNFLANLTALRNAIGVTATIPTNLTTQAMTITRANQLENCILAMDTRLSQMEAGVTERYSGEPYADTYDVPIYIPQS